MRSILFFLIKLVCVACETKMNEQLAILFSFVFFVYARIAFGSRLVAQLPDMYDCGTWYRVEDGTMPSCLGPMGRSLRTVPLIHSASETFTCRPLSAKDLDGLTV